MEKKKEAEATPGQVVAPPKLWRDLYKAIDSLNAEIDKLETIGGGLGLGDQAGSKLVGEWINGNALEEHGLSTPNLLFAINRSNEYLEKLMDDRATIDILLDPSKGVISNRTIDGSHTLQGALDFADSLRDIITKVNTILEARLRPPKTFALPSHDIMLTLITLWAGKTTRIPRAIIDKPAANRTPEERQQVAAFIKSIIWQESSYSYDQGHEEKTDTHYALISNNPKVRATAEIEGTLWGEDKLFQQEVLGAYITRTFGPEGMRHLLAFLIGLDEAGRSGDFIWRANEHLERMGKKPDKHTRAFKPADRKTALDILKVLTSLIITAEVKQGKREKIQAMKLFNIEGYEVETFDQQVIKEGIAVHATNVWYKDAMAPPDGSTPQFTKLLKKIAQEDHRNHPLTLYMAPLFAIMWRMDGPGGRKISIENLMQWCKLEPRGKYGIEKYNDLLSELDYMKHADYLGSWTLEPKGPDKYKGMLTLTPPEWFNNEMAAIEAKKEVYLSLPPGGDKPLSPEEFNQIFETSGLSQRQFANRVGVSQQAISKITKGLGKPSKQLSIKIRAAFPDLVS